MSSNKVVKKEKLRAFKSIWDFFAGNNKNPKTMEVLIDLFKLEVSIKKVHLLDKQQIKFESETQELEEAKTIFYDISTSQAEYVSAKKKIEKILKIRL